MWDMAGPGVVAAVVSAGGVVPPQAASPRTIRKVSNSAMIFFMYPYLLW